MTALTKQNGFAAYPHPNPTTPTPAPAPAPAQVTPAGAAWLASAAAYPRSTLSLWEARPTDSAVLPCGSVFDVVSVPAVFGRRMLDRLWADGPGSGPVATHRGRMLLFTCPGTAQRLPSLLAWEEWGRGGCRTGNAAEGGGRDTAVPPLLCHGSGDAVTVPPLSAPDAPADAGPRWLVAPDVRHPWLPGAEAMLWACVRAARPGPSTGTRISIFPPTDPGANVYDVSRRR
ncbi:bifunctional DNA primase/polymerase [Streptomyces sp. ISL-99]|uniref:bifunctional DNA primase/polymerase n=1 Tax=Streptomyces sp. ISL-99 TaxID=2819193 RepID=UPI001BE9B93F|nr:bifunctional DNA primase/polymerase [Streptomyces sp. ISL-99]MBT2523906.1 bifunctional DNA primase/polymerase [Streptomyces sp. ISL-99]